MDDKKVWVLVIIGCLLIDIGIIVTVVEMLIDHNCYQLESNDKYEKTICEKYWK